MKQQPFLRNRLDGEAIYRNIQELLAWLLVGHRPVYPAPDPGTPSKLVTPATLETTPVNSWEPLDDRDIKQLSLVLNTQIRLLAKVLPDLKSVEMRDVSEAPSYSTEDLAQKVLSVVGSVEALAASTSAASSDSPPARKH